ncbi:MAG: phenylalanine--tRNA ligase subunit alpha [Firmicutes bacterium]|nr:phenylalanine--tRNA ligase subunit alpha [Bacillota bacterium]
MEREIRAIEKEAGDAISRAESLESLEELRVKYLGRKGALTQALRGIGAAPERERPVLGRLANEARDAIERLLADRRQFLAEVETSRRLREEAIDVTLPGVPRAVGTKHVVQQVLEEIEGIFSGMGFEIEEGPEIETDYYNFVALNFPKDHPARDMQATFLVSPDIVPGRVYRRDPADASHSPVFTQVEGLAVDRDVSLGDLKGTLEEFARRFYGPETRTRFRPSYFPFTEPSAEVDVSCTVCGGTGCAVCGGTGWLEILGAGMVHPQVLRNGGYDPDIVTGFAFGMGVERIAMLKFGIDDIRLFFNGDLRFLQQF